MSESGVVEDPDDAEADASEDDALVPLVVFGVLGAGFVALFAGVDWFWTIWVLGFAVLLPAVAVLSDHYGPFLGGGSRDAEPARSRERGADDERRDALETLKERYARGEIDEAEFERRLERLVENESVEDVERRVNERRDDDEAEFDYELEG